MTPVCHIIASFSKISNIVINLLKIGDICQSEEIFSRITTDIDQKALKVSHFN